MDRIILVLEPDPAQQDALTALVAAQHDPESPQYQQWLTPESFGQMFGASDRDLEQVVNWLQGHGFDVEPVSPGRGSVVFSGTAAQVESAFHTEIHVYDVGGEIHHANASDPQIPVALAPVVHGLVSLHDFQSKTQYVPDYTGGSSHYMAPVDFATIYNLGPLYASSTDGAGQSIAIVGRTNLNLADVQAFRSKMGLPPKDPAIILNGADPGIISSGELGEATLDVEWSGAVAKNATIQFVVSGSTRSTDGVDLSAQYIVSHNLAPILSLSFGSCEAAMGTSGNQYWNALWQQAAAQGISVFVASGDSGAAGCDSASAGSAAYGAGVNGLCSSPYATCVGGTQFADSANGGLYWSNTTNSANYGSALSYIPEGAWNESGTVAGGGGLWATTGGASIVYPKPVWQTGVGVPAANHRFVPDVSLTASGHDGYIIYMSGQLSVEGGTSASAPSFAGLMALAVQKAGGRQGNANPALYTLAGLQNNNGAAVFHDVTAGNNSVPGQAGFNAGVGYDQATGLGSVDASMLVNHWLDASIPVPSFQLSAPGSTAAVTQGAGKTVALTVTVIGGFSSAVTLSASGLPGGLTTAFAPPSIAAPGSGTSTLTLSASAQTVPGTYNISINGSGGNINHTWPLAVTVSPTCSFSLNPTQASASSAAAGYSVSVAATSGCTWSAATNTSWIAITGTSASAVNYSLSANTSVNQRAGTMTIAGLTFTVTQAAVAFSLDTSAVSVPAGAGTGSITLSAASASAAWTAVSNATWIAITNGASGTGSKSINYSVAANTATTGRIGMMTIAGLTFTVTQAAAAPVVSLNPTAASVSAAAGTGTVALSTSASWTAVSNANWIAITNSASGTGSKTINYSVAVNTATTVRIGTMTIAGLTFTVTQAAAVPVVSLNPTAASVSAAAGTGTTALSATSSWTAVSNATWIAITNGASGTGSKSINYSVAANTAITVRIGTMTIAGLTFTVTQAAAVPVLSLNPSAASVSAAAGTGATALSATSRWTAVSNANWIAIINGGSGTGSKSIAYSFTANPSNTSRAGTLTIAGLTFTITQTGVTPPFSLNPNAANVGYLAGTGSLALTAASVTANWTASSNANWLAIANGQSGTGGKTIAYSYTANTSGAVRMGTLTIAGLTFTVTQAPAAGCVSAIQVGAMTPSAAGVAGSMTVSATPGCSWVATSSASWFTVTSGSPGSGNGTVAFSFTWNTGTAVRTGTITVAGFTLTVTESPSSGPQTSRLRFSNSARGGDIVVK